MMDCIDIEGYKSIRKAKIELRPINILIGANGSGKTNFLSFFEFVRKQYENNLDTYVALKGGVDKFLFRGKKHTNAIHYNIYFEEIKRGLGTTFQNAGDQILISMKHHLYKNKKELSLPINQENDEDYKVKEMSEYLKKLKNYQFQDTTSNSAFTKMSHIENDIFYLYKNGDNLAGMLYHIRETNKITYNLIVKIIQSVAPFFSDFYLESNEGKYLSLKWKDKYCDLVYGVNDLSDGTLRFIALTVLFMQPKLPETIIIDEPELGLHPFAIAKLAGMIKSAASRESQIIIATQSAELISEFDFEDIITVDLINGESVFNRLNSEDWEIWVDNYAIGDLWKQNILNKGYINR
jgi:predicted ATPase